jgi:hypothetical protein
MWEKPLEARSAIVASRSRARVRPLSPSAPEESSRATHLVLCTARHSPQEERKETLHQHGSQHGKELPSLLTPAPPGNASGEQPGRAAPQRARQGQRCQAQRRGAVLGAVGGDCHGGVQSLNGVQVKAGADGVRALQAPLEEPGTAEGGVRGPGAACVVWRVGSLSCCGCSRGFSGGSGVGTSRAAYQHESRWVDPGTHRAPSRNPTTGSKLPLRPERRAT